MVKHHWNWSKDKSKVYDDPIYKRNREIVLKRDMGCCYRCWHLHKRVVLTNVCDHFKNVKSGDKVDHSLFNLGLLCNSCHNLKTSRESKGIDTSKDPFGDFDRDCDGWPIKVDWQSLIRNRTEQYLKGMVDYENN